METVTEDDAEEDGIQWTFSVEDVEASAGVTEAFADDAAYNVAPGKSTKSDKVPMASLLVRTVHKHLNGKPLIILWDSGLSLTWISSHCLPKGCIPARAEKLSSNTLVGQMSSDTQVTLENLVLPEFFKTRVVEKATARVFHADCRYDVIGGRDLMNSLGLVLNFHDQKMTWDDCHVPMREFPTSRVSKEKAGVHPVKEPSPAEILYLDAMEADLFDDDTLPTCDLTELSDDDYLNDDWDDQSDTGNDHAVDHNNNVEEEHDGLAANTIKESKYEEADLEKICRESTHLSQVQLNELLEVLQRYPKLFDNTLGRYPEQIHLDLKDDAKPYCQT